MDREDGDRLETLRRKLQGSGDVPAASAGGIPIDVGWDLDTLVAAQGELGAMVAILLDRERILKTSEPGDMLAIIASVTAGESPVEGEILAIPAAGVQDVVSGL